ncbi:conserved hypothetical protein [metagenome]|uniref:NAD glycohydrolase translocation F5/8 type C domain-containing protein n=1 Tax=metagenome TaxID=256318 RepID=A0A2P2BW67_9ZZZZ
MTYCPACGHALGTSRFCIQCGRPVDDVGVPEHRRTDTAERPAVRPEPVSPVEPVEAPAATTYAARFPLYADEVTETTVETPAPRAESARSASPSRRRPGWPLLALVGLVVAAVIAVGLWRLGATDDTSTAGSGGSGTSTAGGEEPGEPVAPPEDPVELAASSRAEAPATAPPNLDVHGARVRYVAANMLDGTPSTAWRMTGDGTGRTLRFSLPGDVVVTSVGLINGYAKLDRDGGRVISWYERNRRVLSVRWTFDDGSTVDQTLKRTRAMQSLEVGPVRTGSVRLTLLEVSAPAARNGRNYTPISEVSLVGG